MPPVGFAFFLLLPNQPMVTTWRPPFEAARCVKHQVPLVFYNVYKPKFCACSRRFIFYVCIIFFKKMLDI